MRGDAVGVVDLGVARNLVVAQSARPGFSGLNQGPPNAPAAHSWIDVPPLDERHRRGLAALGVLPMVEFQEPDEPPINLGHNGDGPIVSFVEIPLRLRIVVREGTWPQRVAHSEPVGSVARDNLPNSHRRFPVQTPHSVGAPEGRAPSQPATGRRRVRMREALRRCTTPASPRTLRMAAPKAPPRCGRRSVRLRPEGRTETRPAPRRSARWVETLGCPRPRRALRSLTVDSP